MISVIFLLALSAAKGHLSQPTEPEMLRSFPFALASHWCAVVEEFVGDIRLTVTTNSISDADLQ